MTDKEAEILGLFAKIADMDPTPAEYTTITAEAANLEPPIILPGWESRPRKRDGNPGK